MKPVRIESMLNFQYQKTAAEIVDKVNAKLKALRAKIAEREFRIGRLREEHKITDQMVNDFLAKALAQAKRGSEYAYQMSNEVGAAVGDDGGVVQQHVGAGAINHLLTERGYIEAERAQIDKLELISRNLTDITRYTEDGVEYEAKHALSCTELEYLGF